jgi:hypothetical protein
MISPFDSFPDFVPLAPGNCPKYSSKLRFSLTMNTMCWIFCVGGGVVCEFPLPPPHPFKLVKTPAVQENKANNSNNLARTMSPFSDNARNRDDV